MCGIVGFVNYKQNLLNYKKILQNMNNSLSKRGPDEEGYYLKEHVGLAHRRLIVIDPIGGKQPMISSKTEKKHSEIVITYNGQIYNTNELRKTLEENGFTFTSYSDTEVLLKSYIFYGKDVVHHLNGIFSFAIWDSEKE